MGQHMWCGLDYWVEVENKVLLGSAPAASGAGLTVVRERSDNIKVEEAGSSNRLLRLETKTEFGSLDRISPAQVVLISTVDGIICEHSSPKLSYYQNCKNNVIICII